MLYNGKNNHKKVTKLMLGSRNITKYYTVIAGKARLIWEGIRSCFGSGWWINDKPWLNDEAWKN